MKTTKTPKTKKPVDPTMKLEKLPVKALKFDAKNARLHPDRNIDAIKNSLNRFGQQKPIVIDKDNVVQAGNGTLQAALSLGWKEILVVRTNLTAAEAKAFAISDNRTGELAEWDLDQLNQSLEELSRVGIDLTDVSFTDEELKALADDDFETAHAFKPVVTAKVEEEVEEETINEQYAVVITCKNEKEHARVIEYCEKHGFDYRAPSI